MSMQRIKELALTGLSHIEIADQIRHLRPETVRVYFSRVTSSLTADEREQMIKARASRVSPARDIYHRKFSERKAISAEHIRIGRKLLQHRIEQDMTLGQFAKQFNLSNRVNLSAMEQGYHDFTMSEITMIADILKTTIEDLLCPPAGVVTT